MGNHNKKPSNPFLGNDGFALLESDGIDDQPCIFVTVEKALGNFNETYEKFKWHYSPSPVISIRIACKSKESSCGALNVEAVLLHTGCPRSASGG